MEKPKRTIARFFESVIRGQSYINLLYLLGSFPLGVFYFVFLIVGLATGFSLSIIWIGIPILIAVVFGWIALAKLERFAVINLLKEDIPVITLERTKDMDLWSYIKSVLGNSFTWKSLLYLFVKFPLGLVTFVILTVFISLTIVLMSLPFTYDTVQFFKIGISSIPGIPVFEIDNLNKAIIGSLVGLILWPITIQISNGLKILHAQFAKLMLYEVS